ncbi:MAG: C40 family peptidase [Sporomusaceae bacterium]|nr:C40 family peptidase [Sporomusaceae bacterium]
MNKYRIPVTLVLLITLFATFMMPATVMAASPLDSLIQTASSDSGGSSFNLLNVLIGMLLGNILGKSNTPSSPAVTIKNLTPPLSNTQVLGAGGSAKGNALITTAKTYLGVPYVFGASASTTAEFDCSSFTQRVMKENGITIPRTAAEQYEVGTVIDKANLQVGDLVFFTTYKPGASHVGFYMGNRQFIHASSAAKQVTISSLDDTYYTEHYIGARRYIK